MVILGFDSSTQQLKCIALDSKTHTIYKDWKVDFHTELPQYKTQHGVLHNPSKALEYSSPTLLWVHALDLILDKMVSDGFDFSKVKALSGCGQQHGSVYWTKGALSHLQSLDPSRSLVNQLKSCFSIPNSPIWMDSSTRDECLELEKRVGGAQELANITGSAGTERFTTSQILKISKQFPKEYESTERISLVSSFLASLFIQNYASIDQSDGSGMNLLNIQTKSWEPRLLDVCPDLKSKLGSFVVPGNTILGTIGPWFVDKFGFSKGFYIFYNRVFELLECIVSVFTGDNPGSLSCMYLEPGDIVLSLGTSDTLFLGVTNPTPNTFSHILCHPNDSNSFMGMIVYKNGSLTREYIRDKYAQKSWDKFNDLVSKVPVDCDGYSGKYYLVPEISPRAHGITFYKNGDPTDSIPDEYQPRALLEFQFHSMKQHVESLGLQPKRIFATGGASTNKTLLQVCSLVFSIPIYQATSHPNSAALGSALRALSTLEGKNILDYISRDFILIAEP